MIAMVLLGVAADVAAWDWRPMLLAWSNPVTSGLGLLSSNSIVGMAVGTDLS